MNFSQKKKNNTIEVIITTIEIDELDIFTSEDVIVDNENIDNRLSLNGSL